MKTKNILLTLNTIGFSILFYTQNIGLNVVVFNILLLGSLLFTHKKQKPNSKIIFLTITSVFASVLCLYNGSLLSLFIYVISVLMFASVLNEYKLSLQTAFLTGLMSVFISLIERISRKPITKGKHPKKEKISAILVLFIVCVFLIFLIVYSFSNPFFSKLLLKINFDFISFSWVVFTLFAGVVIFGLFYWYADKTMVKQDLSRKIDLKPSIESKTRLFTQIDLLKSGVILFAILNLLILSVNFTDVYYYFIDANSIQNINFSEALHQSVGSLIFSIVMAIALILIYFKGNLNFHKNKKWLVILTVIWIIQNIILAFITVYKNQLYISQYGLTYKRLGVYMFLLLTIIGLVFTYLKISKTKTNWFIFKRMYLVFYLSLFLIATINWDSIIINYNAKQSTIEDKTVHWYYLLSLSNKSIPQLIELGKGDYIKEESVKENFNYYLNDKISQFESNYKNSWQSWSYLNNKTAQYLNIENVFEPIKNVNKNKINDN